MGIRSTTNTAFLGVTKYPPINMRGAYFTLAGEMVSRQNLPDDPQGFFNLTLTNLIVGSSIHIESLTGVSIVNRTAISSTEIFNLSVYAPGSPLNNLKIKIRKGSSPPYYQSWETLVTSVVGSNSIYVAQILD